jgi:hypothetical protein
MWHIILIIERADWFFTENVVDGWNLWTKWSQRSEYSVLINTYGGIKMSSHNVPDRLRVMDTENTWCGVLDFDMLNGGLNPAIYSR